MEDKFTKGVICGLFGSMLDLIVHFIGFFLFNISTTSHYIATLMFGNKINNLELLMGVLVHLMAGAGVGIFFVYILDYIGTQNLYLKGLGLGFALFIIHVVIIPNIITRSHAVVNRDFKEAFIDLIAHIFFGITIAFIYKKTTNRKFIF